MGQTDESSHHVRVARAPRLVAAALCLLVHGCSDVSGGAVELSWKLRPTTGSTLDFISCDDCTPPPGTGAVARIRLDWEVVGYPPDFKTWCCKDGHGVTAFELPPGEALLSVSPVCANDLPATDGTYTAPAPERRKVIVGNTVSLGAVEVVLEVNSCDVQPCICR